MIADSVSGDLILSIDQGTSTSKVVLFDLAGRVVASASGETAIHYPRPTWMESDSESWWKTIADSIRSVIAQIGGRSDRIRVVGLCGFMHTLFPVDEKGRQLYPPILWPDQRSVDETAELASESDLFNRTIGRVPTTMLASPRLAWLRRHHPEAMDRASAFVVSKDFLRLRLTGELATDPYDARGTGLVDKHTGDWSHEVLDRFGLSAAKMPPIRPPDEIVGVVTADAAEETELCSGTPVVTGTGDWLCTVVGSGCCLPESVCFYLGTAGIIGAFQSESDRDRLGSTSYFGSVTATGSALRWIRDVLTPESADGTLAALRPLPDYSALCAEADVMSAPGANGLLFLPHLMGERGGGVRPEARGVFYGLTLAHRRADLVRAVLEGTALWLRQTCGQALAEASPRDLVAFGGGVRSPTWRRIMAAIFHRRLLLPETTEGGALGAAKLAAVGIGVASDYGDLARRWNRVVGVEEPDAYLEEIYESLFARFRELEAAMTPVFSRA